VSLEVASMLKYGCNAFHAMKIAFANEIGGLAAMIGCDGSEVMKLMVRDKQLNISAEYLRPGFAFGGPCLPKDLRALTALANRHERTLPLLAAIMPSNRFQIEEAVETMLSGKARRLAWIGLSFKLGSDDMRESPYVELVRRLLDYGFDIRIYDCDVDPQRVVE